ncbi:B12-binding domain-containing radical SAM protein [Candidatus Omnitrophota bacterium]
MDKNCLLINPIKRLHPPFGLLYIAAALEKADFRVEIFEALSEDVLPIDETFRQLRMKIPRCDPSFIGITCMSAQAPTVRRLTGWIKERFPRIKIVLGGVHPTFMPHQAMGWGADFVVAGEGEKTMVDLAGFITEGGPSADGIGGLYYRKGTEIVSTGRQETIEDLDEIPEPAYHLVPKERFTKRKGEIRGTWLRCAWIWTSRGCPSRCTFCAGHRFFGKKVRYRSLDNIFRELDHLVEKFNIEAFYILDDTFTINSGHVQAFCERLKASYPDLKWSCQARVNFFDELTAKALKDAGCIQVDFGVESGSQRILDLLKKGIKVEQTEKAFSACKKYGIKALATIMIGNPTESLEDVDETRKMLKRIEPDFTAVYFTTPFPGTELYTLARSEGLITDESIEREYRHQLVEPLAWTKVEKKKWEAIYDELSKWSIIDNYLLNPLFLLDMSKFSLMHPGIAGTVLYRFLKGDRKGAFQLLTETSFSV